jgi:hypothetical protein
MSKKLQKLREEQSFSFQAVVNCFGINKNIILSEENKSIGFFSP